MRRAVAYTYIVTPPSRIGHLVEDRLPFLGAGGASAGYPTGMEQPSPSAASSRSSDSTPRSEPKTATRPRTRLRTDVKGGPVPVGNCKAVD